MTRPPVLVAQLVAVAAVFGAAVGVGVGLIAVGVPPDRGCVVSP